MNVQLPLFSLKIILFLFLLLIISSIQSQTNVVYQNLYTSTTFDTKAINTNLPTGSTYGMASAVNGMAGYTIPIPMPPSMNDIKPELSISYSSSGGNGMMGFGWGLTGLSAISRIGQNQYFDTNTTAVDFSTNDRFSIDGNYLKLKTGFYGMPNSEYHTEAENFSVVRAYFTSGINGPSHFVVTTKNGLEMTYGDVALARITNTTGNSVLVWKLTKVEYPDGSAIRYNYTNFDNESKISEIRFASSWASSTGIITFTYKNQQHTNIKYEASTTIKEYSLLDKINITSDGVQFKSFEFKYGKNTVTSYLVEVIEKGSNNTAINSTIFQYGDEKPLTTTNVTSETYERMPGNFDADGRSDLVSTITYSYNNTPYNKRLDITPNGIIKTLGYEYFVYSLGVTGKAAHRFISSSDLNKDFIDEIITTKYFIPDISTNHARLLDIKIFKLAPNLLTISDSSYVSLFGVYYNYLPTKFSYIHTGDFNGDYNPDILLIMHNGNPTSSSTLTKAYIAYGNGTSSYLNYFQEVTMGSSSFTTLANWQDVEKIHIIDFDGNGKSDILAVNGNTSAIFEINNSNQLEQKYYSSNSLILNQDNILYF